jgi:hypothetical protein
VTVIKSEVMISKTSQRFMRSLRAAMRNLVWCVALSFVFQGCSTSYREIAGKVYNPATGDPVAGRRLALVREPVNYPPFSMLLVGVPQPVLLANTYTNAEGRFSFRVRSNRQLVICPLKKLLPKQASSIAAHIDDTAATDFHRTNSYGSSVYFDPHSYALPVSR